MGSKMKTFYTERDIEDLRAAGVTELTVSDDVVLTDLAREKAEQLGVRLKRAEEAGPIQTDRILRNLGAAGKSSAPGQPPSVSNDELARRVKAAVIAKLGTTEYNDLLDQVIPQILARLASPSNSNPPASPSGDY